MISLYSDGDPYTIAWGIQTPDKTMLQWRAQAGMYRDAISAMQSIAINPSTILAF